jgi:hypothetical protein
VITLPALPSHEAILDFQRELREMTDFTGKVIVIRREAHGEPYKTRNHLIAMAAGGSGCVLGAGGNSVYVSYADHAEGALGVGAIFRLASDEETAWFHAEWKESATMA